jgi:hypothetical protein
MEFDVLARVLVWVPGLKSDPIIVRAWHSSDHKVNRASPAEVGKKHVTFGACAHGIGAELCSL